MKVSLGITAAGVAIAIAGATALFGPVGCLVGGLAVAGYGMFGVDVERGGGGA